MGNLHLVTGYAGTPHVASSDHGSLYEALIRDGQFVMEAGANFAASVVTNNQIRVNDGELMIQGRHVKLTPGAYVDLSIANGTQGYFRRDLIVARYTRGAGTGIEECNLVVIKGANAASSPADPECSNGNINAENAQQHDFPLYRVTLSGLNIESITALFEPQKALYESISSHASDKKNPHGVTKKQLGLENVDNTSDKDKPVSSPQITYWNNYIKANYLPLESVVAIGEVDAPQYLDDFLNESIGAHKNKSVLEIVVELTEAFEPFNTKGVLFATAYKASDNVVSLKAIMNHGTEGPVQYLRSKNGDEWGSWRTLADATANVLAGAEVE